MADPVAEKSGFLCMYMSNHPDTLVSYVRYWGKVSEQVASAKMTGIDTKGMNLTYQTKGSTANKDIRIEFDPPLAGYEEVKPRLISMKGEAEEELGMVRAPRVETFTLDSKWKPISLAIGLLFYTTLATKMTSSPYASYFTPGLVILSYLPPWMLTFSWALMIGAHALESLYVLHLCRKHSTGFVVGAQYVLAAIAFGFPAIVSLRKQVQDARIASIMKGQ